MILQTLTLKNPVDFGEERITKLEFKDLKARHLQQLGSSPGFKEFLNLVSVSTGHPIAAINELSIRDAKKAVEIVAGFFDDGQETGEA